MTWTSAKWFWGLTAAIISVVVAGFWFDSDPQAPILGRYSVPTLVRLGWFSVLGYLTVLLLRFLLVVPAARAPRCRAIAFRARLLIVTGLGFLALALAEGGLRWVAYRQAEQSLRERRERVASFDPFLQIVPRAQDSAKHINSWGFRGEQIAREKPAGTYRIFLVGGSTIYAARVGFEQSHPRILERELRRRYPSRRIEVQNAGMHWHTSQHSLIKILFNIQDFDPDLIVVYHAINDLYRSFAVERFSRGDYRGDYSHFLGPVAPILEAYLSARPGLELRVVRAAREQFRDHWFADLRDSPGSGPAGKLTPVTVDSWPSLPAFERNMNSLAGVVENLGAELIIASQPFLYRTDLSEGERARILFPDNFCRFGSSKADIPSMIAGMEAFNAASRRVAQRHALVFVDLEKAVPKTLEFFRDDVHYTVAGNRLIGSLLAERISARGNIDQQLPR